MNRRLTVVAIIFFILAAAFTFPLVLKILGYIPGFFSSDENISSLWDSWKIKYSHEHHLGLAGHTDLVAYPFGVSLHTDGYVSLFWQTLLFILAIFTTPVLSYNIQAIINLILSGVFTYLLVYRIAKDNSIAIFSGIIFAFCPYQFARLWQHLGLTYNEWIPLALFCFILLQQEPSRRHGFLFFISLILALSFDYTIMYLTAVCLGLFFIFCLIQRKGGKGYIKKTLLAAGAALLILSFQFIPILVHRFSAPASAAASAHNPYYRPFEDLFAQSARPLSYVLPAAVHPVFGKFTEQFIGSGLYGESLTEHTLYLGWVPLVLAFLAVKRLKKRERDPDGARPTASEIFYIRSFFFLAIAAWLFSQPPFWYIFGFKIYMPSFFMYKILPMFRAYCRFGIILELAVAVLAGLGLKYVLGRFKSRILKTAIAILFSAAVLFEFWNWPPYKVIDVSKFPQVYSWLKAQPPNTVIAEYPMDFRSPNEMYKLYQTKHEKRLINSTWPGTYAHDVAQEIAKLSSPSCAGILRWMGARYVLVHRNEYLDSDLIEDKKEPDLIRVNPGLKLVRSFPAEECPNNDIMCVQATGPIDVYEVTALPIAPRAKSKGLTTPVS